VGKLLFLRFDVQLADGLSMCESHGFFDVLDTPGWDTWIWYEIDEAAALGGRGIDEILAAWVPPCLFELAERGMAVNPVACLTWADDPKFKTLPLVQFLRREGLV